MLPSDFAKKWAIILGIVILAVIGSSFLLSRQLSITPKTSSNTSEQRRFPTEIASQINSSFKILYQDPKDKEGRTIIYDGKNMPYLSNASLSFKPTIGLFANWENIAGNKDRYVSLNDPVSNKIIPKIRIVLSSFPSNTEDLKATALAVENLNTGKVENPKKLIKDIAQNKLDKLFQKGDAIVVFPLLMDSRIIYDENNIAYAQWVFVRRYNGVSTVDL